MYAFQSSSEPNKEVLNKVLTFYTSFFKQSELLMVTYFIPTFAKYLRYENALFSNETVLNVQCGVGYMESGC